MEILILIIGFFVFFESNSKDINVANNKEKTNREYQIKLSEKTTNQELKFEIFNKNGIWVFAPMQGKNKINTMEIKKQNSFEQFITLPDGSKIEIGI
ncbi:MAG: hypothetical protein Rsou_0324 [Candidatus Ruthia sp. Asou_11_S2]|nr:hypothetical protein [Candidatus Ruthia sp. Asou_11_S2]